MFTSEKSNEDAVDDGQQIVFEKDKHGAINKVAEDSTAIQVDLEAPSSLLPSFL